MQDCTVTLEGAPQGQLVCRREGLYWQFDAVLQPYTGLRRLFVQSGAGKPLLLGTPEPEAGQMRLRRRVSATQLAQDGFDPEGALTAVLTLPGEAPLSNREARPAPPGAGVTFRAEPPALLEAFDPTQPITLAAWFGALTPETVDGRRFLVLPLANINSSFQE